MKTPGQMLQRAILHAGLTQTELAHRMGRPVSAINEMCHDHKALTARTALQLEAVFGVAAIEWLTRQAEYQLAIARAEARLRSRAGARR